MEAPRRIPASDHKLSAEEMKAPSGSGLGGYGLMTNSRLSVRISVFLLGLSTSW